MSLWEALQTVLQWFTYSRFLNFATKQEDLLMPNDFDFDLVETTGNQRKSSAPSSPVRDRVENGEVTYEGVTFTRDTVFTTGKIAKIFRVAPRTVSKWFDSGRLKGSRVPGSQDRRIPYANAVEFARNYDQPAALEVLLRVDHRCSEILWVGREHESTALGNMLEHPIQIKVVNSGFDAGVAVSSGNVAAALIDLSLIDSSVAASLARALFTEHKLIVIALWDDSCGGFDRSVFHETFRKPLDEALCSARLMQLINS